MKYFLRGLTRSTKKHPKAQLQQLTTVRQQSQLRFYKDFKGSTRFYGVVIPSDTVARAKVSAHWRKQYSVILQQIEDTSTTVCIKASNQIRSQHAQQNQIYCPQKQKSSKNNSNAWIETTKTMANNLIFLPLQILLIGIDLLVRRRVYALKK